MIHWHDLKQGISKHSISTMADANQHNLKQESAVFCADLGWNSLPAICLWFHDVPRFHGEFPESNTQGVLERLEIFRGSQAAAGDASDLGYG
jgi:hypothetical protein